MILDSYRSYAVIQSGLARMGVTSRVILTVAGQWSSGGSSEGPGSLATLGLADALLH
jgi:hypothetical protein